MLFGRLFSGGGGLSESLSLIGLTGINILLILTSVALLIIMDNLITYEGEGDSSDIITSRGRFVYLIWTVVIVWVLLYSKDMISTFIYFAF